MGKLISVVSGKGGTGKTTFTASVGLALAAMGRHVLCMDCDITLRNLDLALGLSDSALMDFSDVLSGSCSLADAVTTHPRYQKLDFLPAPLTFREPSYSAAQLLRLAASIRENYDFCLIDAPAGLGTGFRMATDMADSVIVVTTTDVSALRDAQHTVMELDRFPVGRVHLVVNRVQKKLLRRKKQLRLPEQAVRWGQKVKYLVLAGIVVLCAAGVYGKLSGTSPWEVFSRLTALRLPPEGFGVGILLFVLILIGMAVHPRFFCQFLCPMGAVFALLPVLPFAQLHRDGEQCIPGCNACANHCPVSLKLDEASLRSGECIGCEACVGICPRENISRWDIRRAGNTVLPVLAKAVLFFRMGVCLGFCRFF